MASFSFTLFNVVDDLFGRPILLTGIIMDLLPDLKMRENNHETTNSDSDINISKQKQSWKLQQSLLT